MLAATGGDIETDKKSIVNFIHGCCLPNIVAARDRYNKAVEGGKKGGRPKKLNEDDEQVIAQLKEEGKTSKEIGQLFGVSDKTIRRSGGWTKPKEMDKMSGQNQNLYKDIYNDNDIYKDNET